MLQHRGTFNEDFGWARHVSLAIADDGSSGAVVMTAGEADGVLPGIVRGCVLRASAALSIPVVQQAPHWSSHARWREAFLTNRWAHLFCVRFLLATSVLSSFFKPVWKR